MPDREDEQTPEPVGQGSCSACGVPLAADQRYCLGCGARRGELPVAVAGALAGPASTESASAANGGPGKGSGAGVAGGDGDAGGGTGDDGWSWMPSPQAIAIAVVAMLALGVGLGSSLSEVANSAPLSTILLEYPQRALEGSSDGEAEGEEEAEESTGEEAPLLAEAPEEEPVLPEEGPVEPLPEEPLPEEATEEPAPEEESALERSIRESEEEQEGLGEEEAEGGTLPQVKHAWLIVLGENSYEKTYSATAEAPYLTRVLPGKGLLIPHYYGVTSGVLANEVALLSGQGPTPETAVNCPNPTAIAPATVSALAGQVEGNGCVYPSTVESLPTQLEEKELSWRAYVEDMEKGGEIGQPFRCRRPTLDAPDSSAARPGDQYLNWRNPVVYFDGVTEDVAGCEKHDVGFEILTKDLAAKKATPALSLIFPNACHSGGEVECEPGAPTGAKGATQLLKTLVPAIMASPAYEEGGGLIAITSAQAPQAGEKPDPSACCLAPAYPNLLAATGTTPAPAAKEEAPTPTKYTEESVLETGGGGEVGLLLISPLVEAGKVEETEYANHFTLLKTLESMFGVEPLGYAAEEEVPTLSPDLFVEPPVEEPATEEPTPRK